VGAAVSLICSSTKDIGDKKFINCKNNMEGEEFTCGEKDVSGKEFIHGETNVGHGKFIGDGELTIGEKFVGDDKFNIGGKNIVDKKSLSFFSNTFKQFDIFKVGGLIFIFPILFFMIYRK
jgi:hypothetical protein